MVARVDIRWFTFSLLLSVTNRIKMQYSELNWIQIVTIFVSATTNVLFNNIPSVTGIVNWHIWRRVENFATLQPWWPFVSLCNGLDQTDTMNRYHESWWKRAIFRIFISTFNTLFLKFYLTQNWWYDLLEELSNESLLFFFNFVQSLKNINM